MKNPKIYTFYGCSVPINHLCVHLKLMPKMKFGRNLLNPITHSPERRFIHKLCIFKLKSINITIELIYKKYTLNLTITNKRITFRSEKQKNSQPSITELTQGYFNFFIFH